MPSRIPTWTYRAAASRIHAEEGTLEIDEGARVSRSPDDEGAYVQAWVWVYDDDIQDEDLTAAAQRRFAFAKPKRASKKRSGRKQRV